MFHYSYHSLINLYPVDVMIFIGFDWLVVNEYSNVLQHNKYLYDAPHHSNITLESAIVVLVIPLLNTILQYRKNQSNSSIHTYTINYGAKLHRHSNVNVYNNYINRRRIIHISAYNWLYSVWNYVMHWNFNQNIFNCTVGAIQFLLLRLSHAVHNTMDSLFSLDDLLF